MKSRIFLTWLLVGCTPAIAFAQTDPGAAGASTTKTPTVAGEAVGLTTASSTAEPAERGGLEEIVVTATRREESLQKIPVTVTAITANTLQAAGLSDLRNLTQVVPAFFGGKNLGLFLPVIRGVGSSSSSAADEANVATYIDGVYQPDPFSTFIDLGKVERVEVLRGPQGTVFGRNATGGLINVITPDPQFDTTGDVSVRYGRLRGDASDVDARGYITTGLSDTLAADLSGVYRKTDDYVTDLVRGGHLGGNRVLDLRSKLLWKPSSTSQIVLTGEYTDQDGSTNTLQPLNGNTAGRRFPGVIVPTRPFQTATDSAPALNFTRYNLALRTRFDLGEVNLETTTGYMHNRTFQTTDSDSSNILLGIVTADGITTESLSQEVRLLSAGSGPFKWLLGVYGFRLDADANILITSRPGGPGTAQTQTLFQPDLQTTSYAGFGEGTYEIVPSLFLTAGLRYTYEKREFTQVLNGNNLFGRANKSFDKITYRASVRYEFADSANIYASYGTGYKSGVFNYTNTTPTAVEPETIDSYEIGLKADPIRWLRSNLSMFYYNYDNLQVTARAPTGNSFILQNAASAEIYGGELELTAAVNRDLNLRASATYTHADYKRFPLAQTYVPLPTGGNSAVTADVSGNQITRSPRTSFNAGFDWGHDLASGRLSINGNLYHSARVYFDFADRFSQKPYTLIGGEISWTTEDEKLRLSIWAANLTDAKVFREIRNGPLTTDVTYETPRRVGVGASYKF